MIILFKILNMVDLEKQKKKERRRGPLMQRGFSPFFLFMGIQDKSPPPPRKKEKNALFQAFQTGFLITQFSFLTVVHFTVCNSHKVPSVILSPRGPDYHAPLSSLHT